MAFSNMRRGFHMFFVVVVVALAVIVQRAAADPVRSIVIDGSFDDWADVPSYYGEGARVCAHEIELDPAASALMMPTPARS